jgi:hypothetical protein
MDTYFQTKVVSYSSSKSRSHKFELKEGNFHQTVDKQNAESRTMICIPSKKKEIHKQFTLGIVSHLCTQTRSPLILVRACAFRVSKRISIQELNMS